MPGCLTELVVTFLKEKSVREIVSAPLSEGVEVSWGRWGYCWSCSKLHVVCLCLVGVCMLVQGDYHGVQNVYKLKILYI